MLSFFFFLFTCVHMEARIPDTRFSSSVNSPVMHQCHLRSHWKEWILLLITCLGTLPRCSSCRRWSRRSSSTHSARQWSEWGFTMKKDAFHSFQSTVPGWCRTRPGAAQGWRDIWGGHFWPTFVRTRLTWARPHDRRQDLLCLPSLPCRRKERGRHSCQVRRIQGSTCRENISICLQPDKNHRCPFASRQGQFGQRFYQKAWEPWSALSVTNS